MDADDSPHELLRELGRGGVAIVHMARRRVDGERVAVKRLRPELARNVGIRRMFVAEARVTACVNHPNVVRVLRSGFDSKGVPWMEMEWAAGLSLQTVMDVAPLPRPLFLWVARQVLLGLEAAHCAHDAQGKPLHLVHRDVSPHNILIAQDGAVKVLDFGIAKIRDSQAETTTGAIKGKVTYMAPEQVAQEPVDRRTDLFAVGVMLYQGVTHQRFWRGAAEPEILARLLRKDLPDVGAEVDEALRAVVTRAISPTPAGRFASAAEMQRALEQAEGGLAEASDRARDLAAHLREFFGEELREQQETNVLAASGPPAPAVDAAPGKRRRAPWLAAGAVLGLTGAVLGLTDLWLGIGRFSGSPSAAPSAAAATLAPRVCRACGVGQMCGRDGSCVGALMNGCTLHIPDGAPSSDPIYLGSLFPLTGPDAEAYGRSNARGAELAVREINRYAGGIPAAAGERRPLALFSCDDHGPDAEARARFLADRVSGVVGFRSSDEALRLSRDIFLPAGVLVVSALNASPLLAQLPAGTPRRFYRTAPSATAFAEPLARIARDMLVPSVRARPAHKSLLRVVILRNGDATGVAYADAVLRAFGSVSGVEVRELGLGSDASPRAEGPAALESALATLRAAPPDIVVGLSDGLFRSIIAPLEASLRGPEVTRPLYLGATPWEEEGFASFVLRGPERRRRFYSVSWPTAHRAMASFIERYREGFGEALIPSTASPAPYDTVYLLAYLAAAAGSARPSGSALAAKIGSILPAPGATERTVGPATVLTDLNLVAGGGTVDLQGVVSRFDFDPTTGDSPVDAIVQCTRLDPSTRKVDAVDIPIAAGVPRCE